jgi:hypothetical protein
MNLMLNLSMASGMPMKNSVVFDIWSVVFCEGLF